MGAFFDGKYNLYFITICLIGGLNIMWISKTKLNMLFQKVEDLNQRLSTLEQAVLKTYDCCVVLNDGTKVRYCGIKAVNTNIAIELAQNMYEKETSGKIFYTTASERKE